MKIRGINNELLWSLLISNVLALVVGFTIVVALILLKKRNPAFKLPFSYVIFLILFCYSFSLASLTIVPVPYTEHYRPTNINLVPLFNTYENLIDPAKREKRLFSPDVFYNIIGNILLFLPFGILLPIVRPKPASFKKIVIAGALTSISIETIQYFSKFIHNYRQVDIDDVIFNVLGVMLGFGIYKIWLASNSTQEIALVTH